MVYVVVTRHAIESIATEGFGKIGKDHLLDIIGERIEGGAHAGHCGLLCVLNVECKVNKLKGFGML